MTSYNTFFGSSDVRLEYYTVDYPLGNHIDLISSRRLIYPYLLLLKVYLLQ